VSVVAHFSVDVEVVEEREVARDRVCVRRDLFAEERQRRIAIAARDIAEDLVVGAVLANDVENVFDRR
jgi:hypothetical protein